MIKKHFVFSYTNILIREIEKKKYFSFIRKIFNLLYKLFINTFKKNLGQIQNLDKKVSFEYKNFPLGKLLTFLIVIKVILLINKDKSLKTHNYTIFMKNILKL